MCRHVRAFQHLRESTKGTNNTLDQLEGGLRALSKALRQALRIVRIPRHAAPVHAASVHASAVHATAVHASHAAAVHATISATKSTVWRRVRGVSTITAHSAHPVRTRAIRARAIRSVHS